MSLSPWVFLAALALGGCVAARDQSFRERLLGTIPEDARVVVPVAFSADGRTAAWVERRGDACRTVSGDRKGKPYGVVC